MRKWTMSACLVAASCVLPLMAATGSRGPGVPQASISIASSNSSTQAAPAAPPATSLTLTAFAAPRVATGPAGTWTVRPGDTLSSIAVALAVPGGWQALYAANKRAVGPQPNLIRSGTVLQVAAERTYTVAPGDTLASIAAALRTRGGWQALYAASKRVIGPDPDLIRPGTALTLPSQQAASHPAAAPAPARRQHQARATTPATPKAAAQRAPVRNHNTTPGDIMPRWLKLILLLAGLLTLTSFVIEPVAVLARRRRQAAQAAHASQAAQAGEEPSKGASPRYAAPPDGCPRPAKSRIIQADHDRLIVTYSAHDDTVYLLTPPGEDPWSVLRASRIVVPEHTFVELADHLGVPSVWPYE